MGRFHPCFLPSATFRQLASLWWIRRSDVGRVIFDSGSDVAVREYTHPSATRPNAASTGWCSRWVGRCALDYGAAESLNSTLKVEFVHRRHFRSWAEARLKIATWIADFYNVKRCHSANNWLPPVTFERQVIETRHASSALLGGAVT